MSPENGLTFVEGKYVTKTMSGAVSPMIRAAPSKHVVIIPERAAGKTTWKNALLLVAPSANAAYRKSCGTSLNTSSDSLIIVGNISKNSAIEPRTADLWINPVKYKLAKTKRPETMDGNPVSD